MGMALKVYISQKLIFGKKEAESDVMLCLKSEPDTEDCSLPFVNCTTYILDDTHKGEWHMTPLHSPLLEWYEVHSASCLPCSPLSV